MLSVPTRLGLVGSTTVPYRAIMACKSKKWRLGIILKELKNSMSMSSVSTTSTTHQPTDQQPSTNPTTSGSIFYVSATIESTTTDDEVRNPEICEEQEQSLLLLDPNDLSHSNGIGFELLNTTGDERVERAGSSLNNPHSRAHTSKTKTSGGSEMGGNLSSLETGTNGNWRESGSSRESWNEKTSSSRTSSSSNYHSESPFDNSHEQESHVRGRIDGKTSQPSSPSLSSRTPRGTNQVKVKKTLRGLLTKGSRGESFEEPEYTHSPLPSLTNTPIGSVSSNSPAKALFSKVKELGTRNHKKLRRFSFSTKSSQSDHNESRRASETSLSTRKQSTAAIDIVKGPNHLLIQRISSEDEELNSLPNRPDSITSETEEYNGPFVGRAIALVDCISSPYDLHALSYKKGDIIEIIEKKPTGSWKGKLNNKVGSFKFINVQVLPDESDFEDREENRVDVTGPTSLEYPSSFLYSSVNSSGINSRRRMKMTSPLTPWEMETRQTVANVINGIRKENAALLLNKRTKEEQFSHTSHHHLQQQHSKSLDSESPFHQQDHLPSSSYPKKTKGSTGRKKTSSVSLKKGRPRSVGDLLRRINLEDHISVFILHGFESLDLFKELEEEDLDRLAILEPADRGKILTAVELLREYDASEEIPPIIIPTYSCPSQINLLDQVEDHLNQILEPPPNFTRGNGSGGAVVRDSGVFLKCDDKEEEDPEIEEIILSPANLSLKTLNPSDKFLLTNLLNKNQKQILNQSKPLGSNQSETIVHIETLENMDNSNMTHQFSSLEEHYGEVRQRFLDAKSLFEKCTTEGQSQGQGQSQGHSSNSQSMKTLQPEYKNQFLYCEKSSDSGISLGANSPPPTTFE